jgi:energy-coupling factor transporter ATP-binding protein EcfA2
MGNIVGGISSFFTALMLGIFQAVIIIIAIILAGVVAKIVISKLLFRRSLAKNLAGNKMICLFIKIPPDNEYKEDAMAAFLQTLHRVLPNNTPLSLEMASSNQFIKFYLVIPKFHKNIFESQLYAQYSDAEVEEVKDYLPDLKNAAVAQMKFKNLSIYPLNTYHNLKEGLLKTLSAILSKTETGEEVYFQIALTRVGSRWWDRGFHSVQYYLFGKKPASEESESPTEYKWSQEIYKGKLRVAYIATDRMTAERKLKSLLGVFKAVKGHNELKRKKFFVVRETLLQSFKARIYESGDLWSPVELATIYHFPYAGSVVSNVVKSTSRHAPAPDTLPVKGQIDENEASFFGETNYRNEKKVFGIKRIDRRRHLYIVGKTGSGKSRLLEMLLISDIQSGQGCCLIDPHGDLADELLMFVPKERIDDVVYVNPTDRDFPIGFNPLEPVESYEERQHLSRFFIAIFKKLFAENWNSRMEHLIRYITLALLETPDSNVLGITRMLSDINFRQRVIKQLQDPVVKSFWTNEFSTSNEQFIDVAAVPIMNKVGQFISNPIIRNMVGQRKNMLDFDKFMNEGKIVIVNLSKGKLGEDNAALLGSMIITKIQQAALARASMAEEQRRDFYFYVDEFQNFATDAFSSILSEARKYHLDLTIAHQYIAQLPDDVKATAFGNVGSIIVFPVGGDDAAYLTKEFSPTFTADDMINLNVREMYIKMSIDGKLNPPFSGRTINVPKPQFDYSADILDRTRTKYTRNRVTVENEIAKWSNASESITSDESGGGFPEPII